MKKHAFNIKVASEVGVNAAIVFENIAFWVQQNAAAGRNIRDGSAWTYGSVREIAERFEYMTQKQVRGALDRLKAAELIKTDNFNRMKYDKTLWYGLTEKGERIAESGETESEVGHHDLPSEADGDDRKVKPIPIINPDIDPKLKRRIEALRAELGAS